ncbi:MAG: RNA polymerase factor sigma-32 [Desulfobacteraceae bacterium]|nr:RNA polymerase factor sigma-32 [Desulfobacteraceae bacterium]
MDIEVPEAEQSDTTRKLKEAVSGPRKEGNLIGYDPLQQYFSEISRNPLLTREQEIELGHGIREEGDPDAAYILTTSNLRLVVKLAMEFQQTWMQNFMDLIQEDNIGLMHAVQKFDPSKNVKFSYYAAFWIKAYILKFIMNNWRLVKIGTTQGQRKLFFQLKKEKQELVAQGFMPETKFLSSRLGVSEQEVRDMDQRLDGWDLSLDEPLMHDSDTEWGDFFSSDSESIENQVARKELNSVLRKKASDFKKQLSERDIDIFEKRVFTDTPVTLQEIGDTYQISRERVRQLKNNIVKKMSAFFEKEIPDFASYKNSGEVAHVESL